MLKHCALVAALTVSLAGCYESEFPLDPAPLVDVSSPLLGTWRCLPLDGDVDEKPAVLTIARDARARYYDATWLEPGDEPDRYEAFASTVGDLTLMNIRDRRPPGAAPAKWVFGRVTLLQPNVLQVQIADDKALADVERSRPALRAAFERRRTSPSLFTGGCVCARTKTSP